MKTGVAVSLGVGFLAGIVVGAYVDWLRRVRFPNGGGEVAIELDDEEDFE